MAESAAAQSPVGSAATAAAAGSPACVLAAKGIVRCGKASDEAVAVADCTRAEPCMDKAFRPDAKSAYFDCFASATCDARCAETAFGKLAPTAALAKLRKHCARTTKKCKSIRCDKLSGGIIVGLTDGPVASIDVCFDEATCEAKASCVAGALVSVMSSLASCKEADKSSTAMSSSPSSSSGPSPTRPGGRDYLHDPDEGPGSFFSDRVDALRGVEGMILDTPRSALPWAAGKELHVMATPGTRLGGLAPKHLLADFEGEVASSFMADFALSDCDAVLAWLRQQLGPTSWKGATQWVGKKAKVELSRNEQQCSVTVARASK